MGRIFGTDGVRGIANTEISCTLAMNVGRAAAMVIAERIGRKPVILIGKDTRISSDMLEAAITAGLCSVGADAVLTGVLPTPALSCLIPRSQADGGIMLSASHNPYEFNGIKIFGPEGVKLTDAEEFEIEQIVLDKAKPYSIRWGWELGRIQHRENLLETYIDFIAGTAADGLGGLKIAVDCSNGSASATAAALFDRLDADIQILSDRPNGVNINRDCGSTNIERLSDFVAHGDFDAGIAFDGDADRCLALDEKGNLIDGDVIMAILADDMLANGRLKKRTIVATAYSNLGLFKFAEERAINLETAKVGDRYVLERMMRRGYNLGGEQSGHIIQLDHMPAGDGQLTAVRLLSILSRSERKMSEIASLMRVYPQVMMNIQADSVMKSKMDVDTGVAKILDDARAELGSEGRIILRASGTEPLIRLMMEGDDREKITVLAERVADQLQERLSNNEDYKKLEGY